MTWNNDMSAAPRDGTVIIAGSFNVPWADSHLEGRIYRVWWQDEFDAFIEGCRQMTMAAGTMGFIAATIARMDGKRLTYKGLINA